MSCSLALITKPVVSVAPRTARFSRLRDEAGGRWFNYLPAYLWVGPIWVVASVLATPGLNTLGEFGLMALANTAGVLAAVGLMALSNASVFRNSQARPIPLWLVIAFGAAVGAIKALVTTLVAVSITHGPLDGIGPRTAISAILGAWLIPTISVLYATLARYERERDALARELVLRKFRPALGGGSTQHSYDQNISSFVELTRKLVAHARNPLELNRTLNTIIDTELRPLSRTLSEQVRQSLPSFRIPDLIRIVWKDYRFTPVATTIAYVITFIAPQLWYAGIANGLLRLLVQAFIVCGILWLAQLLPTRGGAFGVMAFALVNGFLVFVLDAVSIFLFGPLPDYPRWGAVTFLLLFFVVSGLILGTIRAAQNEEKDVRAQLTELSEQTAQAYSMSAQQQFEKRELAHYLHSRVQNGMLSVALRLGADGAPADISPAQEELYAILDEVLTVSSQRELSDISTELRSIQGLWKGLAGVNFSIDPSTERLLNSDRDLRRTAVLVIEEGTTNAVRHGSATQIHISIGSGATTTDVSIHCVDNGKGPVGNHSGLGTTLFESAATSWSLTRRAGDRTELEVRLESSAS